jgi:hypothetical protein
MPNTLQIKCLKLWACFTVNFNVNKKKKKKTPSKINVVILSFQITVILTLITNKKLWKPSKKKKNPPV